MAESNYKTYRDVFDDNFASQFGDHKEDFLDLEFTDSFKIDVEKVAEVLNTPIEYSNIEQSGSIELSAHKKSIKVNSSEVSYRQRFTIAHEIGHEVLKHLDKDKVLFRAVQSFNPEIEDKLQERQANDFAANLLMPEKLVNYYTRELEIKDVNELARRFDVSSISMEYRLINLGYM